MAFVHHESSKYYSEITKINPTKKSKQKNNSKMNSEIPRHANHFIEDYHHLNNQEYLENLKYNSTQLNMPNQNILKTFENNQKNTNQNIQSDFHTEKMRLTNRKAGIYYLSHPGKGISEPFTNSQL